MKHIEKYVLVGFFSAAVAKYLFFSGSLSDVAAFSSLGALLFLYERYTAKKEHAQLQVDLAALRKQLEQSQKQVSEIINYFNITKVMPNRFGQGSNNGTKPL